MFTNTPNKAVYLSRSVAVAVCVYSEVNKSVLLVRRGESVSHKGLLCMPCGYLDYDETLIQAARRETYEETGLLFDETGFELVRIDDSVESNLQNITFIYFVNSDRTFSSYSLDQWSKALSSKECVDKRWMKESDIDSKFFNFAFNHDEIIKNILTNRKIVVE